MTTKTTKATPEQTGTAPATPAGPAGRPDPLPEQQPWRSPEDAKGWRVVYRGTGQRREITSGLVLELTPEQRAWVGQRARAAGITPHAIIKQLIDEARAADGSAAPEDDHRG